MKNVKKIGVHIVYKEEEPSAIFFRDEKSGENVIYIIQKANLEDIEGLFLKEDKKV